MRTVALVVAVCCGWAGTARAQDLPPPPPPAPEIPPPPMPDAPAPETVKAANVALTVNPLGIALVWLFLNMPGGSVQAEIPVADLVSILVEPGAFHSPNLIYFSGLRLTMIVVLGGANFWPLGQALKGFWVGPRVGASYVTASDSAGSTASGFLVPFLVQTGYQWIWGAFVLSLGGGLGYQIGQVSGNGVTVPLGGFTLNLDARIGAAF